MSINSKLQSALAALKGAGADFADIYFEIASSHSYSFDDGTFEEISSSNSEGVGARVLRKDGTAMAHAPGVLLSTAFDCLRKASGELGGVLPQGGGSPVRVMDREAPLPSPDFSFFSPLDRRIRNGSMWVKQVSMNLSTLAKSFTVFTSDGVLAGDRRKYTYFSVEVVVEKDGVIQTGYESEARALPSRETFASFSPQKTAERALSRALLMLDAPECPAGSMPVLLSGEAGGTMVHEACGHGLEADIIQKDYSVYRDRIGCRVASPLVTLVDDGSLPGFLGSSAWDDEGTPCGRTVLIDKGILKGYLTDITSARRGNLPLTGNGRRSSYRAVPQPRMTNTFIEPGTSSLEDMIRSMDRGLLVKKMGGGEVNPTSGDFVFQVTEGYLVEGGKIVSPVRGAVLTGNGPEALLSIEAVGSDLHFLPGMCGKGGQNVPVTDGQPSLLLRNIVVGGSGA
ncbi:TldD/PmbA family protein [Aminivibrio sp.]